MCFQILGFDIMLTQELKPILLEINQMPSFTCDALLDTRIKRGLLTDVYKTLNLNMPRKRQYKAEKLKKFHERMMKPKDIPRIDKKDEKAAALMIEAEKKRRAEEKIK